MTNIIFKAYTYATALNSLMNWFAIVPELPNTGLDILITINYNIYSFILFYGFSLKCLYYFPGPGWVIFNYNHDRRKSIIVL